jgi:alanine-glyoxylate transaminase/serine-glyoxylate transaminase/serine-pyruvate transaminase
MLSPNPTLATIGLGYVGLGQRAIQRLQDVKPGPYYNLDLRRWLKSHADNDVPFTPPVSLIRGQKVACELILKEGLDNVVSVAAKPG